MPGICPEGGGVGEEGIWLVHKFTLLEESCILVIGRELSCDRVGMLTRVLSIIPDWLVREQWDLQQENWNNIFWSSQANREERILPFFIPFPNSAHKQNLLKKSRAMNWFVKMEWQISVQPVRDVGHLQWSQIFPWDRGEMDLWISLLTKISHELDSTWHLQIADYI